MEFVLLSTEKDKYEAHSEGNGEKKATEGGQVAVGAVNSDEQLSQAGEIVEKDAQREGHEKKEATDREQAAVEALSSTNQPSQSGVTDEKKHNQKTVKEKKQLVNTEKGEQQAAIELLNPSAQLPQTEAQDKKENKTEAEEGNDPKETEANLLLTPEQLLRWTGICETKTQIITDIRQLEMGYNEVYQRMNLNGREIKETEYSDAKRIMIEFTMIFVRRGLDKVAKRLATLGKFLESQVTNVDDLLSQPIFLRQLRKLLSQIGKAKETVIEKYWLVHKVAHPLHEQHISSKMSTRSKQEQEKEGAADKSKGPNQKEAKQEHNALEKDEQANEEVQENQAKERTGDSEQQAQKEEKDEDEKGFSYKFVLETGMNLHKFFSKFEAIEEAHNPTEPKATPVEKDESVQAAAGEEDRNVSNPEVTGASRGWKLPLRTVTIAGVVITMTKDPEDFPDRLKRIIAERFAGKVCQTRKQQAQEASLNVGSEEPSKPDDVAQESGTAKAREVEEVPKAAETSPGEPGVGL